jgi:hypothetical protein
VRLADAIHEDGQVGLATLEDGTEPMEPFGPQRASALPLACEPYRPRRRPPAAQRAVRTASAPPFPAIVPNWNAASVALR